MHFKLERALKTAPEAAAVLMLMDGVRRLSGRSRSWKLLVPAGPQRPRGSGETSSTFRPLALHRSLI